MDDFERRTFNKNQGVLELSQIIEQGDPNVLKSNKYVAPTPAGPFINTASQGILGFLDAMKKRIIDQRYKFLFKPGDYEPDLNGRINKDLSVLLATWLGHEKPITILDLSGIPSEIMISISGTLLKIIYDALIWGQSLNVGGRKQPILIVLEEAHNYLKAGEESISSRTVQAISKEGRKFGVGLLLVTQRPTELDETVLSQCGSLIAMRMYNSIDRNHVAASVQDELQNIINLLPGLRTGEGLIIGEAVKIPSRVRFFKISKAPKSSDPIVSEEWMKERPDNSEYNKVVELWRNQSFS